MGVSCLTSIVALTLGSRGTPIGLHQGLITGTQGPHSRLALRPPAHHNRGQDGHLDDPFLVPRAEIPAPEKIEAVSPHTPHKEAPGRL